MRAIDVHVHPITKEYRNALGHFVDAQEALFKVDLSAKSAEEMAHDFALNDIYGMVIAWDSQTTIGGGIITNDFVAALSTDYPDAFLPGWAMVDPWKGEAALKELERAIKDLGLIGPKWHPPVQAFEVNDQRLYPFYDLCQSLGAPMLVHTGMTGVGQGLPGGGGIKNKYGKPFPGLDDVAADFPNLTIIAGHSGWPWYEELIAIALHKPNVFIEVSGYRPKYLPKELKHEISRRLQDKIMFGSDYPAFSPVQCLDELEMEGFKPGIIDKLFIKNAVRALKLDHVLKARSEGRREISQGGAA